MSAEVVFMPTDERLAEIALLGALLIDPKLMAESEPVLKDASCLSMTGRRLYEAIQNCWDKHRTVDLVLVMAEVDVEQAPHVKELALAGLADCPMSKNARRYADILERRAAHIDTVNQAAALSDAVQEREPPARIREHIEALTALVEGSSGDGTVKPFDLQEIMDEPSLPVPYVIEGWLARRDFAIIGGEQGTGKSVFGLDLAIALASGTEFLESFKPDKGYRVVYIDEEMAPLLARRRIRQIITGRQLEPDQVALSYFNGCRMNLDSPDGRLMLRRICDKLQPEWIFFDSLVRFHRGNENDSGDMSRLFGVLKSFRDEFDVGMLALHHLAKPGGKDSSKELGHRLRGSSDISAAVDQLWGITGEKSTDVRTLEHDKNRWGRSSVSMTMSWNEDDDGESATLTGESQATGSTDVITGMLLRSATVGCSREQIIEVMAADYTAASAAKITTNVLGMLKKQGIAKSSRLGRRAHYWHRDYAPQRCFDGDLKGSDDG